jgi:hypothetical protein
VAALALVVAGCGGQAAEETPAPPASTEQVKGTDTIRVVLTPQAAERLGVQTAPVKSDGSGGEKVVIPYAAVLYDANGETWTYTNPEPRVFVRHDISVDRIEGGIAILSEGPPVDTAVVTVGAAELWGVEYGEIEED